MSDSKPKSWLHTRNNIEGIAIAIVLAFVLRAFLIEAFVIPTGSMANGLSGEHFRLTCACCGQEWVYGLQKSESSGVIGLNPKPVIPQGAICPNCNYPYASEYRSLPAARPVQISGGDRVLVMKYIYELRNPQPWDVVVFKNPQNNRQNYIKRLIGRPGETIEIVHGDIFVKCPGETQFQIRRKPQHAQQVLWHLFYDNDHCPDPQIVSESVINPPEWNCIEGNILRTFDGRVLRVEGDTPATLRFLPGSGGWIPYNGYNARQGQQGRQGPDPTNDICSDFQLRFTLKPLGETAADATVTFAIRDHLFRMRYTDGTGITLLHRKRADLDAKWETVLTAAHPRKAGKPITLIVEHVDWEFRVLDESGETLVSLPSAVYPHDHATASYWGNLLAHQVALQDTLSDLEAQPATPETLQQCNALRAELEIAKAHYQMAMTPAIELPAAAGCELWHTKLSRDVFYTSFSLDHAWRRQGAQFNYLRSLWKNPNEPLGPNSWRRDPCDGSYLAWGVQGNPIALRQFPDDPDRDEFFCLGDNSAQSLDGRGWQAAAPTLQLTDAQGNPLYQFGTVPRRNLLGRAALVYWAAGYRLPILHWPIVPNAGNIRLIR